MTSNDFNAVDRSSRKPQPISMVSQQRKWKGHLSYKQLQPQLLRTLVEVAIAGSQAGAARALGLSQPTVWEQVHALERFLEVPLMEVSGRVCILTPHGERLVQMVLPLLEGFESLKHRFQEVAKQARQTLTIVAPPRIIQEDLSLCYQELEKRHPEAAVSLIECDDELVISEVLDVRADLGWSSCVPNVDQRKYVDSTSSYDVDNYLITPLNHPLARKRTVKPEDILNYRVLNGHAMLYGPRLQAIEAQLESSPANRSRIALYYLFTVRVLVKQGLGVAIVPRRASRKSDPGLHERNMSAYFGRASINAVQRRGVQHPLVSEFVEMIAKRMK